MIQGKVGLIGLGVIGTPIAHKLHNAYQDGFVLVADEKRRAVLENQRMEINGEDFRPRIISDKSELDSPLDLLIVCVKNYSLENAIEEIRNVVSDSTIILPLQNGTHSFEFFSEQFPNNTILQGYLQGPNTERNGSVMRYTNSGVMHIGDQVNSVLDIAARVYAYLGMAGVDVHLEQDIKRMVWKKMMLNVAGNSVTALTNADYSSFKENTTLQDLCRRAMYEFIKVAAAEGINLDRSDVEDVIDYYVNYKGKKRTSMLEDMRHHRKTENEYLSGTICALAKIHDIEVPIIETLNSLIEIKENLYLQ